MRFWILLSLFLFEHKGTKPYDYDCVTDQIMHLPVFRLKLFTYFKPFMHHCAFMPRLKRLVNASENPVQFSKSILKLKLQAQTDVKESYRTL